MPASVAQQVGELRGELTGLKTLVTDQDNRDQKQFLRLHEAISKIDERTDLMARKFDVLQGLMERTVPTVQRWEARLAQINARRSVWTKIGLFVTTLIGTVAVVWGMFTDWWTRGG